ncbi:MAG: RNA methyltransferase [Anaerolineaceae bacterium]|nr:MAG: RNA methyltransferase [Anaerolineaceae bacterium]
MITSLQNDRVKLAYGLQNRTGTRRKERKIALEGRRLIADALALGVKPTFVMYQPAKIDYDWLATLQDRGVELLEVSDAVMAHLSDTRQSQGVLAVCALPLPRQPRQPRRALILDSVRDPGNLGTIFRTAAAAGVDVAILSPDCVDPYNPKVLRSGMGAHFRLPIFESDWGEIAAYCQPLTVYAAAGDGDMRYDRADFTAPHAIIIGSEAHGVSRKSRDLAAHTLYIPMASATESLNAALAASVILFEASRQNLTDSPDSL